MFKNRVMGYGIVALIAVLLLGGLVVTTVQSKAKSTVGVVNMEAVFTNYMAPPLYTARDEMQKEFDQKSAELSEEDKVKTFEDYQEKLTVLENEYNGNIMAAVQKGADAKGLDTVLDSAAVLHGGVDITQDVLNSLK